MRSLHFDISGDDGLVWVRTLDGETEIDVECCGYVFRPYWPGSLGSEPEWFRDEIEELLEWWRKEDRQSREEWRHEQSLMRGDYLAMCIGRP